MPSLLSLVSRGEAACLKATLSLILSYLLKEQGRVLGCSFGWIWKLGPWGKGDTSASGSRKWVRGGEAQGLTIGGQSELLPQKNKQNNLTDVGVIRRRDTSECPSHGAWQPWSFFPLCLSLSPFFSLSFISPFCHIFFSIFALFA